MNHRIFTHVSSSRKNFTLIELLIVIAIIAILAAMLIPALGKAKDVAYAAACTGKIKSLGQSWAVYLADHDDILPHVYSNRNTGESLHNKFNVSSPGKTWVEYMFPELTKHSRPTNKTWYERLQCPAHTNLAFSLNGMVNSPYVSKNSPSYGMTEYGIGGNYYSNDGAKSNGWFYGPFKTTWMKRGADIRKPAAMMAFGDTQGKAVGGTDMVYNGNASGGTHIAGWIPNDVSNVTVSGLLVHYNAFRHSGRQNMVMCDGHTELLTREAICLDNRFRSLWGCPE